MTATKRFTTWFFSAPKGERSFREIIFWWEVRRIPYNFIIGSVGFIGLMFFYFAMKPAPISSKEISGEPFELTIFTIIGFPIALNFCYTLGWIVETALGKVWDDDRFSLASRMMRFGMDISLFIVLVPTVVSVLIFLSQVFSAR